MSERKGPEYVFPVTKPRSMLPLAAAAAVPCVALAAWFFHGRAASQASAASTQARLDGIIRALDSVTRAKVTRWSVREGKSILSEIDYFDGGNWRVDRPGFDIRIYTPLFFEQYESQAKVAVVFRSGTAPGVSYLTLHNRFSDDLLGPTSFRRADGFTIGFQPLIGGVYGITIANETARSSFQVEGPSNRVVGWQAQQKRYDGSWVTTSAASVSYTDPFPDSTCDPMMFPQPRVGIRDFMSRWRKLLKGIVAQTGSGRDRVTLHGAAFNSEGELVIVADAPYLGPVVDQYGTPYVFVGGSTREQGGLGYYRFFPTRGSLPAIPCSFVTGVRKPSPGGAKTLPPIKFTVRDRVEGIAPQYFLATDVVFDRFGAKEERFRRLSDWYATAPPGQQGPNLPPPDLDRAIYYIGLLLQEELKDPDATDLAISFDYARKTALLSALGREREAAMAQALSDSYRAWPTSPLQSKRVTVSDY